MEIPYNVDIDIENIDTHGKLCHLDAIDLSKLSLAKRYALITMSGPWISDDYGRFATLPSALPSLPALSDIEALTAVRALIKERRMKTWNIGGKTCWEVAGAYAFKPGLKAAMDKRKRIAQRKKKELALRRRRKKAAEAGIPFLEEDDGSYDMNNPSISVIEIRTTRGNLVPPRHGLWYRSTVPVPKGQPRNKLLVRQPDKSHGITLRLLPSFNPSAGLSALGTVIRYYLLLESDDYGRVRLDVPNLNRQLGKAITKRYSKKAVNEELIAMEKRGYLKVFRRPTGTFAYLRDSAQHLMKDKRYNRNIPKLIKEDREFTYDSEAYKAFFKLCEEHSLASDLVFVDSYPVRGKLHCVYEFAHVAAKRFVREYNEMVSKEPYSLMTPAQYCGLEPWQEGFQHLGALDQFWHAVNHDLPLEQLGNLYVEHNEELDGAGSGSKRRNTHVILRHLLGMTPRAYMEKLRRSKDEDPSEQHGDDCGHSTLIQESDAEISPESGSLGRCVNAGDLLIRMAYDLINADMIAAEMKFQDIHGSPTAEPHWLYLHRNDGIVWNLDLRALNDEPKLGQVLRLVLFTKTILAHDAKPILRWLHETFGFMPSGVRCTLTAARLLSNGATGEGDDLDACLQRYVHPGNAGVADTISSPGESLIHRGASKVVLLHRLHTVMAVRIVENALEYDWLQRNSGLPALAAMETNGDVNP
jgi:hypothetical protein